MMQLGFDFNSRSEFDCSIERGIEIYRDMILRHDAAMVEGRPGEALDIREEAHQLALQINGGAPGILANDNSPGYVLARATAAPDGTVPKWGQTGNFEVKVGSMKVRIEMEGMFGLAWHTDWPGFSAHAVEADKPFLSATGYRSFLGIHADYVPGLTPETFACGVIEAHCKGLKKLPTIAASYRR